MVVKIQNHTAKVSDQRIRVTSEVLTCIKLIKMYAWEKPFAKIIKGTENLAFCSEPKDAMPNLLGMSFMLWRWFCALWRTFLWLISVNFFFFFFFFFYLLDLRRQEKKLLEKSGYIQSLTISTLFVAPTVSTAVMILIHTYLQMELTASVVSIWGTLFPVPSPDRKFSHVSFPCPCPSRSEGFVNG